MKTLNLSTMPAELDRILLQTPDTGKDDGQKDDPHRDLNARLNIGGKSIGLFTARFCDPPTYYCGLAYCDNCG